MHCVVTGGLGFIGSHLVDRLLKDEHTVQIIDSRRGSRETLRDRLQQADVLFHFAGSMIPNQSNAWPAEDVASTLVSTIGLLTQAAECGIGKVVFASSGGTVYGIPSQTPISESHPTDPTSSYGIVKLSTEKYLALFESLHRLEYVALRFSNLYGEGQDPFRKFGVVASFLGAIARDQPIEIWGDGTIVRDFLYIEDAVEVILRAALYTGRERIFNVGSSSGTSINQLLTVVEKVTGTTSKVAHMPARRADVPVVILDIAKARRELGWFPSTPLEAGVARTWAWCADNFAGVTQGPIAQTGRARP
jgi:UDP-glucose 4-epimerase